MKRSRLSLLVLILLVTVAAALVPVEPAEACYTCTELHDPWGNPPQGFCLGDAPSSTGWANCAPQTQGCILFFQCGFWDVRCD